MGRPRRPYQRFCPMFRGWSAVVLADRHRQVGEQVDGEARLVAQDVGDVLLRRRAEEVDVELEHRVAEPLGRLAGRLAGRGDLARDPPHGQDDRRHGRAVEQGEGVRIPRQGQGGVEVRSRRHGMGGIERVRVAAHRLEDERHRVRRPTASSSRSAPGPGPGPAAGRAAPVASTVATTNRSQATGFIGPPSFFMRSPSFPIPLIASAQGLGSAIMSLGGTNCLL